MSRNMKIVLGVIGVIVALCCLLGVVAAFLVPRFATQFAEQAFVDDPEHAAEVGRSIIDYELPPGYREEGAVNVAGTRMVFITSASRNAVIMLMQFPAALRADEAEMERQMRQSLEQQSGRQGLNLSTVGTEEIVINDRAVTLTTREGTDQNGAAVRQVTGAFEAKNGAIAMLMMMGPIDGWNEAEIDQFIDSLR
jgi:hypothetical protein